MREPMIALSVVLDHLEEHARTWERQAWDETLQGHARLAALSSAKAAVLVQASRDIEQAARWATVAS